MADGVGHLLVEVLFGWGEVVLDRMRPTLGEQGLPVEGQEALLQVTAHEVRSVRYHGEEFKSWIARHSNGGSISQALHDIASLVYSCPWIAGTDRQDKPSLMPFFEPADVLRQPQSRCRRTQPLARHGLFMPPQAPERNEDRPFALLDLREHLGFVKQVRKPFGLSPLL